MTKVRWLIGLIILGSSTLVCAQTVDSSSHQVSVDTITSPTPIATVPQPVVASPSTILTQAPTVAGSQPAPLLPVSTGTTIAAPDTTFQQSGALSSVGAVTQSLVTTTLPNISSLTVQASGSPACLTNPASLYTTSSSGPPPDFIRVINSIPTTSYTHETLVGSGDTL